MKTTRRTFLHTSALASIAAIGASNADAASLKPSVALDTKELDGYEIAGRHPLMRTKAGPTYFEGMLLGNGDIGVCAVVRPDALGLHISKSDSWDVRVTEGSEKDVRPFAEILDMWKRASEELKQKGYKPGDSVENADFFREYLNKVGHSYSKPWPRPWPCGTVWVKWDARWVEPVTYRLNPANGVFTLELKIQSLDHDPRTASVTVFVDRESGRVTVGSDSLPGVSVIYSPAIDGFRSGAFDSGHIESHPDQLPRPELTHRTTPTESVFSCFQYFPAIGPSQENPTPPRSERDRNFALHARIAGAWEASAIDSSKSIVFSAATANPVRLDLAVVTPRDVLLSQLEAAQPHGAAPANWITIPQTHVYTEAELATPAHAERSVAASSQVSVPELQRRTETQWREYWSASAVTFDDETLERIWYHNQYFVACCLRKHRTAPGLFANWSSGDIGSAWHSDYHLDYNCQQIYLGVFSSNHIEMHQPYLELVENLLPMSEKSAREGFNLPGAFFPLSAYPVPSQIVPYPVPPWGYQICMTPWAVQSLWWQFLYTQDIKYLARVYPILREATRFLAAYLRKEEDGHYHVFPSISSENWGCTIDFKLNKDCILDLSLIRFVLDATVKASNLLKEDEAERASWQEISGKLAAYPTGQGPYGEVWLDISNAPVEHVYNVPITLAPVFPGDAVGIGTGREFQEIAKRTAQTIRLEGGNDLVSQPLIRARLGMLDLDWLKGQIEYCMLPDGVSNDRVRQSGGRYSLTTDFDFMMRMGLWCENFAVPVVLNECMLQSYSGTIRLFPNTLNLGAARFEKLRCVGAFLVNAAYDGKTVTTFEVLSEQGTPLQFASPWPRRQLRVIRSRDKKVIQPVQAREVDVWEVPTESGERYSIHIA
jgi:alpha-L-fucosidase 2